MSRIERDIGITESLTIYEANMPPGKGTLDPVTVILRDFGGQGQIIVECYGDAWAHWFGAIGSASLREFVASIDEYYLATKLTNSTVRKATKREESYVVHIARAIIDAMKGGA
jgi:hypothetical protein